MIIVFLAGWFLGSGALMLAQSSKRETLAWCGYCMLATALAFFVWGRD